MNFEENKSSLDLEYNNPPMPFDLNKLMNLQFDTLKQAIEWLVSQNQRMNSKIRDIEDMSRPGSPQYIKATPMEPSEIPDVPTTMLTPNVQSKSEPMLPPPPQIIQIESNGSQGIDPAQLNQAISQVMA